MRTSLLVAAGLMFASPALAEGSPDTNAQLEAKINALATELNLLKESLHVPEQEVKKSMFGLGPAASKVYANDGLSIGGYGELFLGKYLGADDERAPDRADTYRFITYMGYKFSDLVLFNAEIEFEHGTTGVNKANGKTGSVSLEFMYVDLMFSKYANMRTGLLLMPMGIVNEMHEPTTFRGNFRPQVEQRIIPSTWREMGVGLYGELGAGLSYKLYLVGGQSAQGFDKKGYRGGRQKGNQTIWEDKGVAARVQYDHRIFTLAGSFYTGGADQDPTQETEVSNTVWEAHAIYHHKGLSLRALYAEGSIDGADKVGALQGSDSPVLVPESLKGYYFEGSYDVMPLINPSSPYGVRPFGRFEKMNLNDSVPTGFEADPSLDTTEIIGGVEFIPHSDVVFKAEYSVLSSQLKDSVDVQEIRFGVGFIY